MQNELTLIEAGRAHTLAAEIAEGRVLVSAEALRGALGYRLEAQGLCQGETCVPVRDRSALVRGDDLDLRELARVTGRPLALDEAERAAALGVALEDQLASLRGLTAPDFTLPDLAGRSHTLSSYRGKKVLLVVYASW